MNNSFPLPIEDNKIKKALKVTDYILKEINGVNDERTN